MDTITAAIVGIILLPLYLFAARPFQVTGSAMTPNFKDGQYYMTRVLHESDQLKHNDVVILLPPTKKDVYYIKRIIAIPGDKVLLKGGNIYLNGYLLDETKNHIEKGTTFGEKFLPDGETITIPENKYFVLGDNRQNSSDSRQWGLIAKDKIKSTVWFCYYNCN